MHSPPPLSLLFTQLFSHARTHTHSHSHSHTHTHTHTHALNLSLPPPLCASPTGVVQERAPPWAVWPGRSCHAGAHVHDAVHAPAEHGRCAADADADAGHAEPCSDARDARHATDAGHARDARHATDARDARDAADARDARDARDAGHATDAGHADAATSVNGHGSAPWCNAAARHEPGSTRHGVSANEEELGWGGDRETERQRGRQTERQRDRETERQKERNGERERDGDRENVCTLAYLHLHSFPRLGPVRVFVVSRQGEMMMSGQSQF